ncbi:MAG TPA: CapA family protein [Intrasporangium sp.]|uniref:CapA family protein n=1 Tax=Intrasporangium sp. TaxID=1925024 RepID=UPI002D76E37B|nr:CapA family protein [Intrasporangium sp.]HET7399388.1 CapA family protein [Intrasporangium sp.]
MDELRLVLAGDVMTGRGVDQVLPSPGAPNLHERHVRDARTYVALAERASGPIAAPVDPTWPWGDALRDADGFDPAVRVMNLETSVTRSDDAVPAKAVHYRMNPGNLDVLRVARVDVWALANNHVLDYGITGLHDTLDTLHAAGLRTAGAGRDEAEAWRPAVATSVTGHRVVVASVADGSSGVPEGWDATASRPGIALLPDLADATADSVVQRVLESSRPGDTRVISVHWGGNWGYGVPRAQRRFAHRLVDGGVDVVHGHSSHHPRPIEVYRGRLVLYGCGDLVNDYEGIGGFEDYRAELRLLYLARLAAGTGRLLELRMIPLRARRLSLERAGAADAGWLARALEEAGRGLGTRVTLGADACLEVAQR